MIVSRLNVALAAASNAAKNRGTPKRSTTRRSREESLRC